LIFRQGSKWYKFDDGDVTEVFMQDDEELKNQCWGGEYLSEVSTVYSVQCTINNVHENRNCAVYTKTFLPNKLILQLLFKQVAIQHQIHIKLLKCLFSLPQYYGSHCTKLIYLNTCYSRCFITC